jgi:hypothetical protein
LIPTYVALKAHGVSTWFGMKHVAIWATMSEWNGQGTLEGTDLKDLKKSWRCKFTTW